MDIFTAITMLSIVILIYMTVVFFLLYLERSHLFAKAEPAGNEYEPTFSIVIPAYNDEKAVGQAIESCLGLDYNAKKVEIIIVDDCSSDSTYNIAKEYEKKHKNVHAFRMQKNSGAAEAKNFGIGNAKNDIIVTMDSDSVVGKNALRQFAVHFSDGETSAVSGAIRVKDPKSVFEKVQDYEYDTILFFRKITESLDSIYVTPGGMSAFKRDKLIEVGGFDKKSLTEDQDIAFKFQERNYKIKGAVDTFAYTVVPNSIIKWINQRVRWIRGGIYNRKAHMRLLDLKYGDFLIFGFLLDFIYIIPTFVFLASGIFKFFSPSMWMYRINVYDMALLSVTPLTFASFLLFATALPLTIHMVNTIRGLAGKEPIRLKEAPYLAAYMFLYGFVWTIAWIIAVYKEIRKEGYSWGTR